MMLLTTMIQTRKKLFTTRRKKTGSLYAKKSVSDSCMKGQDITNKATWTES